MSFVNLRQPSGVRTMEGCSEDDVAIGRLSVRRDVPIEYGHFSRCFVLECSFGDEAVFQQSVVVHRLVVEELDSVDGTSLEFHASQGEGYGLGRLGANRCVPRISTTQIVNHKSIASFSKEPLTLIC